MNLYKNFETDKKCETEGIEVRYGDDEETAPTFVVKRAGGSNTGYQKAMRKALRPFQKLIAHDLMTPEQENSVIKKVFINHLLIGWRNVSDRDGNPLPFSKENAEKLFSDLPDLLEDLVSQSKNASAFKAHLDEDDSKN